MLPRILAILLLLASFILVGKLIYDATIFEFWSTPWVIGILGALLMIGAGVALLFFGQDDEVYIALAIFGCTYAVATAIVYISWAYQHVSNSLPASRYFGFLVLFIVTGTIASVSLRIYSDKEGFPQIYMFPAWLSGFANVGCILFVSYKYVFLQQDWHFWAFTGELIIIVLGAFTFLQTYTAGKMSQMRHANTWSE